MDTTNENKVVAVKCAGCFTEWYSPYYKEPYEDNEEYRAYYDTHILDKQPVSGPSLGEVDDETITGDLQCLAERFTSDTKDWHTATEDFITVVEKCIADGKMRKWQHSECGDVCITPYRKNELPPVNAESLAVYGSYANLVRERVEAI